MKRLALLLLAVLAAVLSLGLLFSWLPHPAHVAAQLSKPELLLWSEDFSDPLPPGAYYVTATLGSGMVDQGSFLLTQDAMNQRGRIFSMTPMLIKNFSAEFHIFLGKHDGADGLAFHFCPVYDYTPGDGNTLDALCPGGTFVAFDTYPGYMDEVYVAQGSFENILVSQFVGDLEDSAWHTAIVKLAAGAVSVTLDGSTVIDRFAIPGFTPFTGYFGFSAATGGETNEQRVDHIRVHTLDEFTIEPNPLLLDICKPGAVTATLAISSETGYSATVTLSDSGVPDGVTTTFSANPVALPGVSIYTVDVGAAVPDGSYNLVVSGQSVTLTYVATLSLYANSLAPGSLLLTSPVQGASDQPLSGINFQWEAASGAATYRLQIDDDADFSSPLVDQSTLSTSYYLLAPSLSPSTLYYWRVGAVNACGETFSQVFAFGTTGMPYGCAYGSTPVSIFREDFETGAPGWTHSGSGDTWAITTTRSHSPEYSYLVLDPPVVTDQRLSSPAIGLPTDLHNLTLQFWNYQNIDFEDFTCYDGGILETSQDGGISWTQVTSGLLTDPYDYPVPAYEGNPLAGKYAWCGAPQDWLNSVVDLSPYAGQTLSFGFRFGTGNLIAAEGWYIDDVLVQGCAPITYSLSVDSLEGGMVSVDPYLPGYEFGAVVTLTAVADPGWAFAGWSGDVVGLDNPLTVVITADTHVVATFERITYPVYLPLVKRD